MGPGSCVRTCHTASQKHSPPCALKPPRPRLPSVSTPPTPHPAPPTCFSTPSHSPPVPVNWDNSEAGNSSYSAQVRRAQPPRFCLSPVNPIQAMPFGTGERKWFIKHAGQVTGRLGIASILFWMPRAASGSRFLAAAPTSLLSLPCSVLALPAGFGQAAPLSTLQLFPPWSARSLPSSHPPPSVRPTLCQNQPALPRCCLVIFHQTTYISSLIQAGSSPGPPSLNHGPGSVQSLGFSGHELISVVPFSPPMPLLTQVLPPSASMALLS